MDKQKNINVLVVDDDEYLLQLILQALSIYEISCDGVTSATKALSKIKSQFYPVIISDIQMPEMNGIELLKKIREKQENETAKSKILLMTAYMSEKIMNQAKEYGMDFFLQKPFEISKLIKSIQKFLT